MARPAFARDRISEYEIFDRHAATAISQLRQRLRQGYAVNFEVNMVFLASSLPNWNSKLTTTSPPRIS